MQVNGRVIKLKGTNAVVKTDRPTACRTCANAAACGKKELKIISVNRIGAQVGDIVTVQVHDDAKALAALAYMFLVPVAIFFISCGLFMLTPIAALACVPLLAAYFILLKSINRRFKAHSEIIEIGARTPDCCQGDKE